MTSASSAGFPALSLIARSIRFDPGMPWSLIRELARVGPDGCRCLDASRTAELILGGRLADERRRHGDDRHQQCELGADRVHEPAPLDRRCKPAAESRDADAVVERAEPEQRHDEARFDEHELPVARLPEAPPGAYLEVGVDDAGDEQHRDRADGDSEKRGTTLAASSQRLFAGVQAISTAVNASSCPHGRGSHMRGIGHERDEAADVRVPGRRRGEHEPDAGCEQSGLAYAPPARRSMLETQCEQRDCDSEPGP